MFFPYDELLKFFRRNGKNRRVRSATLPGCASFKTKKQGQVRKCIFLQRDRKMKTRGIVEGLELRERHSVDHQLLFIICCLDAKPSLRIGFDIFANVECTKQICDVSKAFLKNPL